MNQCLALRSGVRPCVLSIAIKLKKTPTAVERKTIVRFVRELSQQIEANVAAGRIDDDTRHEETGTAYISVARTVAVGPGVYSQGRQHVRFPDQRGRQPFTFGRIGVTTAAALKDDAVLPRGHETRDHVAVWLSDADEEAHSLHKDLDEPLDLLGAKLEKKLAQAKSSAGTGRVLVVSSWMASQVRRASAESMKRLRGRLFRKHERVAGLFMVLHRRNRGPARYGYEIVPILPEDDGLPADFVETLLAVEQQESVPPLTAEGATTT